MTGTCSLSVFEKAWHIALSKMQRKDLAFNCMYSLGGFLKLQNPHYFHTRRQVILVHLRLCTNLVTDSQIMLLVLRHKKNYLSLLNGQDQNSCPGEQSFLTIGAVSRASGSSVLRLHWQSVQAGKDVHHTEPFLCESRRRSTFRGSEMDFRSPFLWPFESQASWEISFVKPSIHTTYNSGKTGMTNNTSPEPPVILGDVASHFCSVIGPLQSFISIVRLGSNGHSLNNPWCGAWNKVVLTTRDGQIIVWGNICKKIKK